MIGNEIVRIERREDGAWTEATPLFLATVPASAAGESDVAVLATLPPPGEYRARARQTWVGYDNSPHENWIAFRIGPETPILGPVTLPASAIAVAEVEPTGRDLLPRSRDPGDRLPLGLSFAPVMPADRKIGTLEEIGFDDAGGGIGMRLPTGAKRPRIDRDKHLVLINPTCEVGLQQAASWLGQGQQVRLEARISLLTLAGDETGEAIEQTFPFRVRQR